MSNPGYPVRGQGSTQATPQHALLASSHPSAQLPPPVHQVEQFQPQVDPPWFTNFGSELLAAITPEVTALRRYLGAFVAFQLYILSVVVATSHLDLLLDRPVLLPLLGISLPQGIAFTLLPLLVLAGQIVVGARLGALGRRLEHLSEIASDYERYYEPASARFRALLPAFSLVQIKVGGARSGAALSVWQLALAIPLVVLPTILMLAVLIRCLPLHSDGLTWLHRALILAQVPILVAVLRLCRPAAAQQQAMNRAATPRLLRATLWTGLSAALCLALLVATIPDELIDRVMRNTVSVMAPGHSGEAAAAQRTVFAPTGLLFDGLLNPKTGLPTSMFSRNLVVTDRVISANGSGRLSLRGRDLRYARLDRSTLQGVDLSGANLTGASLVETNLSGAVLALVELTGSQLIATDLSNTTILQSNFALANLALTKFENAKMQCDRAQVCGLSRALLQNVMGLPSEIVEAVKQNGQK